MPERFSSIVKWIVRRKSVEAESSGRCPQGDHV